MQIVEEYTASEDDEPQPIANVKISPNVKNEKQQTPKPKTINPVNSKGKQGTITSFFLKK